MVVESFAYGLEISNLADALLTELALVAEAVFE